MKARDSVQNTTSDKPWMITLEYTPHAILIWYIDWCTISPDTYKHRFTFTSKNYLLFKISIIYSPLLRHSTKPLASAFIGSTTFENLEHDFSPLKLLSSWQY